MSIVDTAGMVGELIKKGATIGLQEKIMQLRQEALDLQEENHRLRSESLELRKENESLKAVVEGLKSTLEAEPKAEELSEDERNILVTLSDGEGRTVEMIVAGAHLSTVKTQHNLDQLLQQGYVDCTMSLGIRPTLYRLSSKGRAYLVNNKLVE